MSRINQDIGAVPNAFQIYAGEYNVPSPLSQPKLHDLNGFNVPNSNDAGIPNPISSPFELNVDPPSKSPLSITSQQQRSPYTYYDSSMAKRLSENNNYIPRKSPVKHVRIADDEYQTKLAENLYYDMGSMEQQ